jgi:tyrosinase
MRKPALTPAFDNTGVISRYDDLIYTHIQQTFSIHYTGHFLAWHRYYVAAYERMLREECHYKGAQPYWDWTLDTPADQWALSPVFDPVTGFGGNGAWVEDDPTSFFPPVPGRTGGGCVPDGPFAGVPDLVHLGPMDSVVYNPQCLKRDFSPYFAGRYLGMNQTQVTLAAPNFGAFDQVVEGGPSFDASGLHGGGHYGVGGTYGLWILPLSPWMGMYRRRWANARQQAKSATSTPPRLTPSSSCTMPTLTASGGRGRSWTSMLG